MAKVGSSIEDGEGRSRAGRVKPLTHDECAAPAVALEVTELSALTGDTHGAMTTAIFHSSGFSGGPALGEGRRGATAGAHCLCLCPPPTGHPLGWGLVTLHFWLEWPPLPLCTPGTRGLAENWGVEPKLEQDPR